MELPTQRARREERWGARHCSLSAAPHSDGEAGLMTPLQEETMAGFLTAQLEAEAQELDLRVCGSQGCALCTACHAGRDARPAPAHCTGLGAHQAAWRAQGRCESTAVDQMRPKRWPFTPPGEATASGKGGYATGIWTERAPGVCLSHRVLTAFPREMASPLTPAPSLMQYSTPRTRL